MSTYQAAVDLVGEYGIPIFPCNQDKSPRTRNGFKDAATDLEQIDAWFLNSDSLIGVPTGARFFVVDVDPAGAGWYTANAQRLNCGCINNTRRGWHLLYLTPAGVTIKNSAGQIAPGIDVRGVGGYAIWWPGEGLPSTGTIDDIGPPPAWLLQALTRPNGHDHAEHRADDHRAIPDGQRSTRLTSIGGRLRRDGLSVAEIEAALLAINHERCSPPLPDDKVRPIAKSLGRYPSAEDASPPPVSFGEIAIPSMADLVQTNVAPRTWFFEQIIPAGAFLYVGRPKIGKSWFLMQLALAYARGDSFLDYNCLEPGSVLYIAAEDDASRMKERFTLTGQTVPPSNLRVIVGEQFRSLPDQYGHLRLVEFLDGYLRAHPGVKMVLGDTEATMRAIWDGASKGQDIKAKDYGETREFDQLALEHRAFVLLVNHTAKRRNGGYLDLHELINRTNVALAGCSGSIVMADPPDREAGEDESKVRLLGFRGRDLRDDILLAVEQEETGMFRNLGNWTAVAATAAEKEILEAVIEMHQESPGSWIKSKVIAETIGKQAGTVQRTITRMLRAKHDTFQGYRVETMTGKGLRLVSMYGEKL